MILRRFARTIEVEVSPEEFVYRYREQERRVPTRGYIKHIPGEIPSYVFREQPKTNEYVPVSLFFSLPADARKDIVDVLAAFITFGVRPLTSIMRPILVFRGIERFETEFGFEYAAFREAGKLVACEEEVHFKPLTESRE